MNATTSSLTAADTAFLAWFRQFGREIHYFQGTLTIETLDGSACPHVVNRDAIDRLAWEQQLERIFPADAPELDYVWALLRTGQPSDYALVQAQADVRRAREALADAEAELARLTQARAEP